MRFNKDIIHLVVKQLCFFIYLYPMRAFTYKLIFWISVIQRNKDKINLQMENFGLRDLFSLCVVKLNYSG